MLYSWKTEYTHLKNLSKPHIHKTAYTHFFLTKPHIHIPCVYAYMHIHLYTDRQGRQPVRPGWEGEKTMGNPEFLAREPVWTFGTLGHRWMLRGRPVDVLGGCGGLHSAGSSANSQNLGYLAISTVRPGLGVPLLALYPPTSEGSISELRGSQTKSRICRGSYMCWTFERNRSEGLRIKTKKMRAKTHIFLY